MSTPAGVLTRRYDVIAAPPSEAGAAKATAMFLSRDDTAGAAGALGGVAVSRVADTEAVRTLPSASTEDAVTTTEPAFMPVRFRLPVKDPLPATVAGPVTVVVPSVAESVTGRASPTVPVIVLAGWL